MLLSICGTPLVELIYIHFNHEYFFWTFGSAIDVWDGEHPAESVAGNFCQNSIPDFTNVRLSNIPI